MDTQQFRPWHKEEDLIVRAGFTRGSSLAEIKQRLLDELNVDYRTEEEINNRHAGLLKLDAKVRAMMTPRTDDSRTFSQICKDIERNT